MHQAADSMPSAIDVEGVSVRGDTYGDMIAGKLKLAKGSDLAPVLAGLPHDHCQCPHWGYVIEGEIEVTYQSGETETVRAGDLYYWPPGHVVRFTEDTTYVEFSPAEEMAQVLAHVKSKMGLTE
ncbi:MAG: cupin domain-containing protein [Pseudomonadota bacterium]